MTRVGAHLIFGAQREPFLEAALRSVVWADYLCATNTAPEDAQAQENEAIVRRVFARDRLRLERLSMGTMDFARARNAALALADDGDYVLIVDSDDVHYPEFEALVRETVAAGNDVASAHFRHHVAFKDLVHSEPHREILFRKVAGVTFQNTMGTCHEELVHPRQSPKLIDGYRYAHLGYIKGAREVARRWELYRSLGASVHDYDRDQPDKALDDWPRICHLYVGEHPPAVRELLESYPSAPDDVFPRANNRAPRVGLVLLTWNDAENLRTCLDSLARTTEPFELCVVDNGSDDGSPEMVEDWAVAELIEHRVEVKRIADLSLAQALNVGFSTFVDRDDLDFVGWIHPDHTFEWPDWLTELVRGMDEHPEYAKLGASEAGNQFAEPRPGNTQAYLVRSTVLREAGLFDEMFQACGGREDWDINRRLLTVGQVMIWPDAVVRHEAMSTRKRHDNEDAGRENADYYFSKWGTYDAAV